MSAKLLYKYKQAIFKRCFRKLHILKCFFIRHGVQTKTIKININMSLDSIKSESLAVQAKHTKKGRKRLSTEEKRTNKKTTNFNNSELTIVEDLARKNELTISGYIRRAAMGGDSNFDDKETNRKLVRLLGDITKGLNKAIEKAHGRNGRIDSQEAATIASIMLTMTDVLSEIRSNMK